MDELLTELYAAQPQHTLFHYTSLRSLMGIIEHRTLWASEIRYLNDAQELLHFGDLASARSHQLQVEKAEDAQLAEIFGQFDQWQRNRLQNGPLLFVASLTEKGNLLSQWRGYCPHGEGVSLGFKPTELISAAATAGFRIGRCIYDYDQQTGIVDRLLAAVAERAQAAGPATAQQAHPSQSYHSVFEALIDTILRVAALMKHRSFEEETEWRFVSPSLSNYVTAPIQHRASRTMMVPYLHLPLPSTNGKLLLRELVVGPTPTSNLSVNSLVQLLTRTTGSASVTACGIPYRA